MKLRLLSTVSILTTVLGMSGANAWEINPKDDPHNGPIGFGDLPSIECDICADVMDYHAKLTQLKIIQAIGYSGPKGVPSSGLNDAARSAYRQQAGPGDSKGYYPPILGPLFNRSSSGSGGWPPSGPGGVANGGDSPTHNSDGSRRS